MSDTTRCVITATHQVGSRGTVAFVGSSIVRMPPAQLSDFTAPDTFLGLEDFYFRYSRKMAVVVHSNSVEVAICDIVHN